MKSRTSLSILAMTMVVIAAPHWIGCGDRPTAIVIGGGEVEGPIAGELLVVAQEIGTPTNALYRFSMDGSKAQKIDNGPIVHLTLSRNHARMVMNRGDDTLVFLNPDGGNPASLDVPNLVPWYNSYRSFTISPTGRYIAYGAGIDDIHPTIYLARTDGSAGEVLYEGQYGRWAWSPVEDKLAYGSDAGPLHIYDVEANTSVEVTNTFLNPHANTHQMVWTPDGERLAFVEKVSNDFVLTTVNKQGQDRRVLLTNVEWPISEGSSWSPDGRYFALMQFVGEPIEARLVDSNGTTSRTIPGAGETRLLGWSPSGHFVYQQKDTAIKSVTLTGPTLDLAEPETRASRLGPNGRLMHVEYTGPVTTIDADGSNPITYPQTAFCSTTQLSADGKVVAFGPGASVSSNVPIYAAFSENEPTTLVLTAKNQVAIVVMDPIPGTSGVVFLGKNNVGWILPTTNGFKAIYPTPALEDIDSAQFIE